MRDFFPLYLCARFMMTPLFWGIVGFTFLYGQISNFFTKPAPLPDLTLCYHHSCPNPKKAIEILNVKISKKPTDPSLYTLRGNAYCEIRQFDSCLANYDTAIKISPDDADIIVAMV